MKHTISIFLLCCLVFSGCAAPLTISQSTIAPKATVLVKSSTPTSTPKATPKASPAPTPTPTEQLVTILIPAFAFKEGDLLKVAQNSRGKGYESVTINPDGSVTYVMKQSIYEKVIASHIEIVKTSLAKLPQDVPSIQRIIYSDDMSEITLIVKKSKWKSSHFAGIYVAGKSLALFYQLTGQEGRRGTVMAVDEESGEVLKMGVYSYDGVFEGKSGQ